MVVRWGQAVLLVVSQSRYWQAFYLVLVRVPGEECKPASGILEQAEEVGWGLEYAGFRTIPVFSREGESHHQSDPVSLSLTTVWFSFPGGKSTAFAGVG